MDELISVIIPVYNVESYLERCINSVINQTYTNLQIILVDDGSTDNSGSLCDSFATKDIRILVIHKVNGGLSSARNAGIKIAEGNLIGFIDSDDWITIDMYEYLLQILTDYDADVAQVSYINVSNNKIYKYIKKTNYNVVCINNRRDILSTYLINGMSNNKSYPACTKLYKKKLFSNIAFPEGQKYEDMATNYDILSKASKYVISDKICYFYFASPQSITRNGFVLSDFDILKVGEQIREKSYLDPVLRTLGEMTYARTCFVCIGKMLKFGTSNIDITPSQIYNLIISMRQNIVSLLCSSMRFRLKIILITLCLNKTVDYYIIKRNIICKVRHYL